jgi:hypothetical protein
MTNAQMAGKIKCFFNAKLLERLTGWSLQKAKAMCIEQINGRIPGFCVVVFFGSDPAPPESEFFKVHYGAMFGT